MGLGAGEYALGLALLAGITAAATMGAASLVRLWLPGWTGPPAWLATTVLAIGLTVLAAELLGTFGALTAFSLLVLLLLAAGVSWKFAAGEEQLARGAGDESGGEGAGAGGPGGERPPLFDGGSAGDRPRTLELIAGAAVFALVVAHFSIETRISLSEGMSGFDSTWYHGPFAALFATEGSTGGLNFIAPQYLAWFYPQNSELLHGVAILAFDRDLLSPLFSLAWLIGCLGAAWCIGRPFGAGPVSMAGSALVLGSGALADQSGEARNDIPAIFFLLAAAAILVNARRENGLRGGNVPGRGTGTAGYARGVVIVAGAAAGLAAGTKVNYLAPAGALVIGLALTAPRGRRLATLAAAGIPAFLLGGYWYLRNLVQSGNPLPWVKEAGPIGLPSPDQPLGGREEHGVIDYIGDPGVWADWFAPGFRDGFGALWPVLLALGAAGVVLCLVQRRDSLRLLGALILVTVAAWLVAPASAEGPEGSPVGFFSGLRYLAPALALSLALLPAHPWFESRSRLLALLGVYVVVLPFADASSGPWYSAYLSTALAAGAAAFAAALALSEPGRRMAERLGKPVAAAGIAAVALAGVLAGYVIQRDYLEGRYSDPTFAAAGLNDAFAWARDVEGSRIAVTASRQYPFFGTDLSNDVQFVGSERPNGGFVRVRDCREWREALNEGDYDYVVASLDRVSAGGPRFPREAAWTAGAPGVAEVLRRAPTVVFRLSGPLDPQDCPT